MFVKLERSEIANQTMRNSRNLSDTIMNVFDCVRQTIHNTYRRKRFQNDGRGVGHFLAG